MWAIKVALLCTLAEGPAGMDAAEVEDAEEELGTAPSLQLSSAFFANRGPGPDARTVLTQTLEAESHDRMAYFGSIGMVTLLEAGGHRNSRAGNGTFGARAVFALPGGLRGDLGLGVVLGMTASDPGPARRVKRSASLYALAMNGAWDAWRWAPLAIGAFLPARLRRQHHLGPWVAQVQAETTAAISRAPGASGASVSEPAPGQLLQAALGYAVAPRPWLSAGTRLQLVWMPTAPRFRTQAAVRPTVTFTWGRWLLGAHALFNIDEPYGFIGVGERVWAVHLDLGVWL